MENINYSEVLFQSIDQIVEERLKQVQYDRTIACEILEAHPEENLYWVNCEGLKIQVSSIDPKKTYSENTLVYVLVPNGNYENTKVIIGGYSTKDIEKKTYNNSYDNFIPNKTFYVIGESNQMILSVQDSKVLETNAIPYSPIQYNREYDYVGVHWSMQTYQLFDANITSGQYTLEIVFGNPKELNDFDVIVSYPIQSSSIYGNPYSLSEEFEQYNLFPYSEKLNNCSHFKIRLYQGVENQTTKEIEDRFDYSGENEPQIILYSLDLSVGYTNTDFKEEQTLNIGKYESLNYKLNDSNSLERTLYFDWRIVDKNKENQIFNYNNSNFHDFMNNAHIYWLQYQENEGYQSFEKLKNINFDYASIEGLYNWKIIDNNNFKLSVNIDTDYQTDQYKVFIVYDHQVTITDEQGNESQVQQSDYAFTNTIIFENLDIAPIQPGAAIADKPNSLNLELNKGNTGIYNVYGLDGRMVESSKQGPYYITASLYDSLQDKIDKVEWIFPSSNTMIVDARDDNWDKLPNNEKLTVKYRIKTQYYSSATFNIIQCKITMTTGEIRNASVSLQFGEVGNQGTNYAFNIDFIDKDYLTYGQDEEIQIKATLSNQNGEEVLLEDFIDKLEWSWLFVENPDVITNKTDSITNITSISNIICSKYENNIVKLQLGRDFVFSQANYSILQAKLKEYNTGDNIKTDLLTYLCVPVAAADTATIKPRSMQGAARVVYDSLGTATTYSKEAYEIINADGTQVTDLTWELAVDNNYSGLPTLTESKIKVNTNVTGADPVYTTKYKIKPSSYVPPEIPPVAIIAKQGNIIWWSQPILITQNTWFNESINEWTNVLSINQQNDGTILAPLLIAGTKTSNNLFSGVTVGQLAIGSKKVNGVYGFKQGKARFWLNEDAEFFVGNGKDKNIYFDANGKFSIVAKSFDFRTPEEVQNKLILSSTNQEFQIGNENSYLKFYTPEGESQKKFEIKANDFDFNSTNYNGFSMRVGKEGFYTGTEDEYISFEKQQKEDGSQDYYRTLKIKANKFDFSNNAIGLKITDQGLTIGKIPDEGEEVSNYISLDSDGNLIINLANLVINTNEFNLDANDLKLNSNNNGEILIGNETNYLKFYIPTGASEKQFELKTQNFHFALGEEQPDYIEVNFDEEYYFLNWENYYIKDKNGNYIPNTEEEQDYSITYYKKGQKFPTTNGIYCMRDGKNIFSISEQGEINFGPKHSGFYYNETVGTVFNGQITKYFDDFATEEEKADRCWFDDFYLDSLNSPFDGLYGCGLKIYSHAYYNDLHPTAETDFFVGGGSYFEEDDNTDMWYTAAGIIYSNANMYIYAEDTGYLYGTWWLNGDSVIKSDQNAKHDIEGLLSNYEVLFDNLTPVRYKYNNGTSNRYHLGLIAQDVEKAIEISNLTSQDCAALVKDKKENYGLRYGEFIPLNTWQIQKLKARVVELENEIKEIKQRYEI